MSLAYKAKVGFKWTALSQLTIAFTQGINLFLLSKALTPEEFAYVSILLVILGFAQLLIDVGFNNAIIHKQDISQKQLSTLYWLNIIVGFLIFIILNISSGIVERFFNLQGLRQYIQIISVVFLIIPAGLQFLVLFQKNLRFDIIAKIDLVSHISSLVVFIILLLYLNLKIYAFLYSIIYLFLIKNLLLIISGLKLHKPSLYFKMSDISFFLKAGSYQLGERFINYFNSNVDIIIIAKFLDQHSLGLYSLVKEIVYKPIMLINPIITKVVFPLMSKYQNKERVLASIYLKTIKNISLITFTFYWFIFFFSKEILQFLGTQWIKADTILKIMALYVMLRSIGNPVGVLIMAKGRFDLGFYWNLSLLFIIPLAVLLGMLDGIKGIALSLFLMQSFLLFFSWKFLIFRLCNLKLYQYVKTLTLNMIFTLTLNMVLYIMYTILI